MPPVVKRMTNVIHHRGISPPLVGVAYLSRKQPSKAATPPTLINVGKVVGSSILFTPKIVEQSSLGEELQN